jgi:membrane-associated phospholipid phosphatase
MRFPFSDRATPADGVRPGGSRSLNGSGIRPRLLAGLVAAAASAVPVALLALVTRDAAGPVVRLDLRIVRWSAGLALRHGWLRRTAEIGSVVLHPWVFRGLVAVIVVVLLVRGARAAALWAASATLVGGLLSGGLKSLVGRARPQLDDPVATAAGFSFPSGHALGAALFAGVVLVLAWRPLATPGRRAVAVTLAALLVLATGFDRLLLGVHFPSDVVAGWLVAGAVVASSWVAFGRVLREQAQRETDAATGAE